MQTPDVKYSHRRYLILRRIAIGQALVATSSPRPVRTADARFEGAVRAPPLGTWPPFPLHTRDKAGGLQSCRYSTTGLLHGRILL